MLDLEKAKSVFRKYVEGYDTSDSMIRLKQVHTFMVVENARRIAESLSLSEEDIQLAEMIGLLHDIGRFEQAKVYHDFHDALTVDHAQLGVSILKENNFLSEFVEDEKYHNLILTAIANHNQYRIEEGLDERTLLHSRIIRDADKADIFRVRCVDRMEDMTGTDAETVGKTELSDDVYEAFLRGENMVRSMRKTYMDGWVIGLAFLFDFNFPEGIRIVREKDYLSDAVHRVPCESDITREKMEQLLEYGNQWMDSRLNEKKIAYGALPMGQEALVFDIEKRLIDTYEDFDFVDRETALSWTKSKVHFRMDKMTGIYCNDVLCGCYCLERDGKSQLRLSALYLLDGFKHQGIGKQVLNDVLSNINEPVRLMVFQKNEAAVKLYRDSGFEVIQEIRDTRYEMEWKVKA